MVGKDLLMEEGLVSLLKLDTYTTLNKFIKD